MRPSCGLWNSERLWLHCAILILDSAWNVGKLFKRINLSGIRELLLDYCSQFHDVSFLEFFIFFKAKPMMAINPHWKYMWWRISNLLKFRYSEKAIEIWKSLPLEIWRYWVESNFKWKIFSNFIVFSEYPNFNQSQHSYTLFDQSSLIHTLCFWPIFKMIHTT